MCVETGTPTPWVPKPCAPFVREADVRRIARSAISERSSSCKKKRASLAADPCSHTFIPAPDTSQKRRRERHEVPYLTISAMAPAPTVRPPSRMAKRRPFSMATGVCSVISRLTLSPGITISVPSGSFADPVTSVVRK